MKSVYRLLLVGIALSIVSGCYAPSGSGNDPVVGAVLGVEGLVDAKKAREEKKQKAQQQTVNDYLEKK